MPILKLKPGFKDYIWGGHRLVDEYNKDFSGDILAESWELSCNKDCPCIISNGGEEGKTLEAYIEENGFSEVLGKKCSRFGDFPILIKLIDAAKALSIQVHPDEEYASRVEGQHGKNEMWYIVDAKPGAYIYYGFERPISKSEFENSISNNTLEKALHKVEVHRGDAFFIKAGTLHAIGEGILVAEIQQNSNVTYRVYDYGRHDKNGMARELHIDKALDVTDLEPVKYKNEAYPHVASCDYFTVDHVILDGSIVNELSGMVSEESFLHILVLSGDGIISNADEELPYKCGDSFFIPAGSGNYRIFGSGDLLMSYEL